MGKIAILQIVVAVRAGFKDEDARQEIINKGKIFGYNFHVENAERHPIFYLMNCGCTATFNLFFTDGGTKNTAIPDIQTITENLEKWETKTYKLAVVSQELQYFKQYM